MGVWKTPGEDRLAIGFLKTGGEPIMERITQLVTVNMTLEYFLKQFHNTIIVVLRKPGKTVK